MTVLTHILLTLALLWLLILTLLFASVVRHLGAMQVARTPSAAPEAGFNFDTDGPWIPSPLPARAFDAFEKEGVDPRVVTAVFFSAGCGQCLERAAEIVADGVDPTTTVFLVTGNRTKALSEMQRVLEPSGARIIADPAAHDIVKSLDIQSTPFAFRVRDSHVVSKAYVRDIEDFRHLSVDREELMTPEGASPVSSGLPLPGRGQESDG